MLSTKGTRACGLYQKYAEKRGLTLYIPNEEQSDKSQEVINCVKANQLAKAGAIMKELVEELWAERDIPVMTACTERRLAMMHQDCRRSAAFPASVRWQMPACVRCMKR